MIGANLVKSGLIGARLVADGLAGVDLSAGDAYLQMVLGMNPLALWPMGEPGGNIAYDATGRYNGAYTGVELGKPGQFGRTCPYFDGSSDFNNVHSARLAAAIGKTEGTAALWMKVASSSVWTDSTFRYCIEISADAQNRISILRSTTNNTMVLAYRGQNVNKQVVVGSLTSTNWIHLALTWSITADQVKAYVNGAQSGSTATTLTAFTGTIGTEIIGALTTVPASPWSGWLQWAVLLTRPLTPTEVAKLYTG